MRIDAAVEPCGPSSVAGGVSRSGHFSRDCISGANVGNGPELCAPRRRSFPRASSVPSPAVASGSPRTVASSPVRSLPARDEAATARWHPSGTACRDRGDPDKTPQCLAVSDRVIHPYVRTAVPQVHPIPPRHPFHSDQRPVALRFQVVRFDQFENFLPGENPFQVGRKALASRRLLIRRELGFRKIDMLRWLIPSPATCRTICPR